MSTFDKSGNVGYDETDTTLNEELEKFYASVPPQDRQRMMHRLHDAILQRMKEESTRKCFPFIKKYEQCVNSQEPYNIKYCYPHRDAMNDCAKEINSEANYQRFRLMYLRGELLKYHEEKIAGKMETFKVLAPDSIRSWKADYAPKYAEMMEDLGVSPLGNAEQKP